MAAPLSFVRRLHGLQRISPRGSARDISLQILVRVARELFPQLPMPSYRHRLSSTPRLGRTIDGMVDFVVQQPFEEAAYYISCIYSGLCDVAVRRDFAMFFTPPALARHIVERAIKSAGSLRSLRLMDPACGGAAFLLPSVVALRDFLRSQEVGPDGIIRAVNRQIIGIERDRTLAELSRQFIRMAVANEIQASQLEIGPVIRVGNTLELLCRGTLPRTDVVLCNPPYRKIKATELAWHRQRFADAIALQPNLYAMFMHAALQLTAPGGVIALLTPTSYFSGPSYEPVRRAYRSRVQKNATDVKVIATRPERAVALDKELAEAGWQTPHPEETDESMADLIAGAARSIGVMTPFLDIRGSVILKRLLERAHADVQITLILRNLDRPERKDYPLGFPLILDWLRERHVAVYDYSLEHFPGAPIETFHAKLLLVDGVRAYIGSANMTGASFESSMELGVILSGEAARQLSRFVEVVVRCAKPWAL